MNAFSFERYWLNKYPDCLLTPTLQNSSYILYVVRKIQCVLLCHLNTYQSFIDKHNFLIYAQHMNTVCEHEKARMCVFLLEKNKKGEIEREILPNAAEYVRTFYSEIPELEKRLDKDIAYFQQTFTQKEMSQLYSYKDLMKF